MHLCLRTRGEEAPQGRAEAAKQALATGARLVPGHRGSDLSGLWCSEGQTPRREPEQHLGVP